MVYPKRVVICEVGPRDGLQNEKKSVSTEDKLKFIEMLVEANIQRIEATSFVSPKWVPQLADSRELFPKLPQKTGTRFMALVPNMRGLEDAEKAGAKEIAVFVASSETFNKKNMNKGTTEALKDAEIVIKKAKKNNMFVRGYVVTAFYCPYEGKVKPSAALDVAKHYVDFGCDEVVFGDTNGRATPKDVEELLDDILKFVSVEKIGMHFHNTYGCGMANVLKSLEYGITLFDASCGGLGGCPYAPCAGGNVATEDVLYMLHGMGIETGISLEGVVKAKNFTEGILGYKLPSHLGKIVLADIVKQEVKQ